MNNARIMRQVHFALFIKSHHVNSHVQVLHVIKVLKQ